jgi:hypothetical protein
VAVYDDDDMTDTAPPAVLGGTGYFPPNDKKYAALTDADIPDSWLVYYLVLLTSPPLCCIPFKRSRSFRCLLKRCEGQP